MRSDRYGCSRICSHWSVLSGPRLSHTALETATRPTSCNSPATSRSALVPVGRRSCSAAPAVSAATAREWPRKYGLLRSARSPKTSPTRRRSGTVTCGCGSISKTMLRASVSERAGQPLRSIVRKASHQARVEHAACAASYGLHRETAPADGLEQDGDARQSRKARPNGDVLAFQRSGPSLAPPLVVDMEQADLDVLGQLQPPGGVPPELAGGASELVAPVTALRECDERQPRPFGDRPPLRQCGQKGLEHVSERSGVGAASRPVGDEFVAEQPSCLAGIPGTARRDAAARYRRQPGPRTAAARESEQDGSPGRTNAAPYPSGARTPSRPAAIAPPAGPPAAPPPPRV